nr:expressed protein [Hymenolepis microstoma]
MGKKEKKEKEKKEKKSKKEKKEKKSKKEKKEKDEKKHRRKGDRELLKFEISVCGEPSSIALYKNRVQIDADQGTDQEGKILDKTCDLFLCVYTVADRNTVEFLEQKILPEVRALNRKYAIAGLGVENRTGNNPNEVSSATASRLAAKYGCNAMELVACDGNQLAAGTAALYYASNSDLFMPTEVDQSEDKKKKKKGKKSSKDEKSKKEKKEKKKKKKK